MNNDELGLPPGWKKSKAYEKGKCVVYKHLEDFKYAEVRYEPESGAFGHDYALYTVDCDGTYQTDRKGVFEDLSKAIRAGDRL